MPANPESVSFAYAANSELGWIVVVENDAVVERVIFGHRTQHESYAALEQWCRDTGRESPSYREGPSDVLTRLQAFAAGNFDDFLDIELDLADAPRFTKKVIDQCRQVRTGGTASYAQLAASAGSPAAARAVGNVMRTNRFPLLVPCHRIVGSGGSLGGYSAPGELDTKRKLLEMEGTALAASV